MGKTPSRFSDPRRRISENRFGVLYLGATLKVCFLEAVLRDKRNGQVDEYSLDEAEIHARVNATTAPLRALRLVDVRGDGPVRMGIPTDVVRASPHIREEIARAGAQAVIPAKGTAVMPSRMTERNTAGATWSSGCSTS